MINDSSVITIDENRQGVKQKMDWELLEPWGIEKDSDPKIICDVLEERHLALLQMFRNETESAKKNEIEEELKKLEAQLKQTTEVRLGK